MAQEFNIKMDPKLAMPEGVKVPLAKQPPQNVLENFHEILQASIKSVNDLQARAGELQKKTATGEIFDLHQVMVAGMEAGIALELTMQIRNKIIEAYQEISRMQV